jgi:quinol monooxygenase YgiN
MLGFFVFATRSARQARRAPGNLGVDLLRDANNTFRTRTAWKDEAALRAFMMAPPHRHAMGKLAEWCNEASVVHWTQDTSDLPDWREAHRRMVAEGRRSRVKHPTPEHEAFQIAEPKV